MSYRQQHTSLQIELLNCTSYEYSLLNSMLNSPATGFVARLPQVAIHPWTGLPRRLPACQGGAAGLPHPGHCKFGLTKRGLAPSSLTYRPDTAQWRRDPRPTNPEAPLANSDSKLWLGCSWLCWPPSSRMRRSTCTSICTSTTKLTGRGERRIPYHATAQVLRSTTGHRV